MIINLTKKKLIQSVARALSILNCFEDEKELRVHEICSRVGLGKSTVHHLLSTLKEMDYVKQNSETKTYSIGLQAFRIGFSYYEQLDIVKVARFYLQDLCEKTKETVHLGKLVGANVLYLDKVEGPMAVTMRSRIGNFKPAYCTAVGKILLAHKEEAKLKQILDSANIKAYTEKTIIDKQKLLMDLIKCKNQGYATDDEEIEEGLFCVAAPIYDLSGVCVASISVAGPKYRMIERLYFLVNEVKETAKLISKELGYKQKVS